MRLILPRHVLGDAMVVPLEHLVPVAGHLERSRVLVVARDVLVGREQQGEPAAKEEVAVGANGVGLQSPRFDAVRSPAESVVVPAQPLGDASHDPGWIVLAFRVVANLCQPVDGAPVGRIATGQPVSNLRVDLAPRRRLVCHEQQCVGGERQVKPSVAEHDRNGVTVPPLVWHPGRAPVVVRRRLVPQKTQPPACPSVQRGKYRSGCLTRYGRDPG